ncbi:antitoxin [Bacillaceae bacterium JMAK1]|nr:antitoxin [Bacillaceae bacterium JMAK1]
MSNDRSRQITISLPQYLLQEVDNMIKYDGLERNEFIHQAATKYLYEHKAEGVREHMQQGYIEMATINLTIASESFGLEEECEMKMGRRLVSGI